MVQTWQIVAPSKRERDTYASRAQSHETGRVRTREDGRREDETKPRGGRSSGGGAHHP